MDTSSSPGHAIVIGAGGGLGRALVEALCAREDIGSVTALSRRTVEPCHPKVTAGRLDLLDEDSVARAAQACGAPAPRLVICAAGLLHDGALQPEKSLRDLDPASLARVFAVNTIGPALVLKHFSPLLPRRGRCVMAMLSARVGSISDNRLGGWYAYRASKAALNQVVRTASIELARGRHEAIVVGLHPGTVATPLSAPFRSHVAPDDLFTPARSATRLLAVIDGLAPGDSGRCFAWDGSEVPA